MTRVIAGLAAVLSAGFLLSACAGETSNDELVGTSSSLMTLMTITSTSAGSITPDTAYSKKAIEQALPGFTTDTINAAVENRTVWTIAAFSDGMQVAQIYKGRGGKVGAVHGVTHHLAGPNGERIGMTFRQARLNAANCRVGRNLWRGMAICKAAGAPNVQLVFAVPKFTGPFDRLPPPELLDQATLQRIVWTPPA